MKNKSFKILMAVPLLALMLIFTTCSDKEFDAPIMHLPPMMEQFSEYFDIGNIFNPGDVGRNGVTNARLTHHYNVLTAENDMKPDKLSTSRGSYSFSTANRMVNAALASGFKVVGHTLLWHSQIPNWQAALRTDGTSKEDALRYMREYITRVVTEFKGRVYKWDVLNEVFPDGGYNASSNWRDVMRRGNHGNPWYITIGADFVYEGFLAARLADPDAILYYNDYNMDNDRKATMVRDMVRDVNSQYAANLSAIKAANPNVNLDRTNLLIEGIGMQGHHNTGVSVSSIRNSLDLFRPLGVRISISELDVLSQTWDEYSSQVRPTEAGRARAAELYGEYFALFLEYSDIIERVTFWGVYDEQSWRARALPLIFEGVSNTRPKPAYFNIIKALEAHKAK